MENRTPIEIEKMKVTLVNHSSLLININRKIILTDFWNTSPAFGSWLPSTLPFFNPVYLASLSFEKNFYLAISHAHDDHIDDYFLKNYFNKDMKIILNEFPSPSLKKRLNKLGFQNIFTIPNRQIVKFDDFEVITIFDETISNDDAGITFRNQNYCIHHGNDNWFKLKEHNLIKLKEFSKNRKFLYCSQTNSASGHPMSYPQYGSSMKSELFNKVKKMVLTGLENVKNLGADYFLPYAGYSKSYVKEKEYHLNAFDPIYENLIKLIKNEKIENLDKMINIFCGGTFDLERGKVTYPFNFDPERLIKITESYLIKENFIKQCDSYNEKFTNYTINKEKLDDYLNKFYDFVKNYLKRFPNFYPTITAKKICFELVNPNNKEKITKTLHIGNGEILDSDISNKKFIIPSNLFNALYEKKIVFENLYTGYEAEVMRYPLEEYNRDVIMYIDMYGYKYKNS